MGVSSPTSAGLAFSRNLRPHVVAQRRPWNAHAVRLNTLSNVIVLVATVELVVILGTGLSRYCQSYRIQRELACVFGG